MGGTHEAKNGILLRRDIHSLFDSGYVTITPRGKFEVSRRIKEEFENGREYYRWHGADVSLPSSTRLQPDPRFLHWHNERLFKG